MIRCASVPVEIIDKTGGDLRLRVVVASGEYDVELSLDREHAEIPDKFDRTAAPPP
jgi:hypothetical protein